MKDALFHRYHDTLSNWGIQIPCCASTGRKNPAEAGQGGPVYLTRQPARERLEAQHKGDSLMPDNPAIHVGENSPEQVAYKLTQVLAKAEGKDMSVMNANVDRKWLLDTYAECLQAVKGNRYFEER